MTSSSTGRLSSVLDTAGAWALALVWFLPIAFALWTSVHDTGGGATLSLTAPLTLSNFAAAWHAAPFSRYFLNSGLLVIFVTMAQFVVCTLAAYAFARFRFTGERFAFAVVMVQLAILPDALIVGNYQIVGKLGLLDTIVAMGLPYLGSAFGIFLLRQTFKKVPDELVDAARIEGMGEFGILMRIYVPLARSVYVAYGLVIASFHWNNLIWPLIVTNSVDARPVTVGLRVFAEADQGVDWGLVTAATLMTSAPLFLGFVIFQRFFIQNFMRAGIK